MPRPYSNNLRDLLRFTRVQGIQVEEHSTLELTTTGIAAPQRTYYFATAEITINGVKRLVLFEK